MSHRKFEAPRKGNLGLKPRKRSKRIRARVRTFPKDDQTKKCHLTSFIGQKVGMTHVVVDISKHGSKKHKKEWTHAVTLIETPVMKVDGITGQKESPKGLVKHTTVWSSILSKEFKKRQKGGSKGWSKPKDESKKEQALAEIARDCVVVRLLMSSNRTTRKWKSNKSHIMEVQINGGTVADKVKQAKGLLEKKVDVSSVFEERESIDTVAVTKGHGFQGVTSRWGTKKLPRKTHKGLRKVGCIGAWHPSRVMWTVARAGQQGQHARCDHNKLVVKMGSAQTDKLSASTEMDPTEKTINPMGGFPRYGDITSSQVMIKGSMSGVPKRVCVLKKPCRTYNARDAEQVSALKFIDTSSKHGTGRFQTSAEKEAQQTKKMDKK